MVTKTSSKYTNVYVRYAYVNVLYLHTSIYVATQLQSH